MPALPTKEGFFWGRWHTPAQGTQDDGECCSPEEWLACHVVMNCVDRNHPDHLMVFVPGVMALQPLSAFAWGGEIRRPDYAETDRIEPDDYWGFLATPVPVKAAPEWSSPLEDTIKRLDLAAALGMNATWNATGSKALSELLKGACKAIRAQSTPVIGKSSAQ